jgi:2,3-diaminopropionate biosynthesis protein SbnA
MGTALARARSSGRAKLEPSEPPGPAGIAEPMGMESHVSRREGVDRELLARVEALGAALRPTPIVSLAHPRLSLFAKLEYHSVVGSLKDRPAYYMLRDAIRHGVVRRTTTVIESSSGNTGAALAVFCRVLGLTFVPVVDPNIQSHYRGLLQSSCARVVRVDERDATGGYLRTRLAKVKELLETIGDAFWTDQYRNPSAMTAHYEMTAGEIIASFPDLDYVFVGVSTAGTIAGVSRRLKAHFPRLKVVAVDAEGSAIFGRKPRRRYIPGIGSSIVPDLLRWALIDDTVHVRELDTVDGCHELLRKHQILAGGSSGSSYAAVNSYPFPESRPTVLFLCADRGTAYMDTVYDAEWVAWRRKQEDWEPPRRRADLSGPVPVAHP